MNPFVTANGKPVAAQLPCSLEQFLLAQKLLPAAFPLGRGSTQNLRNIPRAVKDADDVQSAGLFHHAIKNQIMRETAHRPETQSRQFGAVGLIARPDFRPLRQRAKT